MADQLYRVYLHTEGDESVREYIVTAVTEQQAKERALNHVKAANLGKGERSQATSQSLTKILAITPTSKPHCLMIYSIPATVIARL